MTGLERLDRMRRLSAILDDDSDGDGATAESEVLALLSAAVRGHEPADESGDVAMAPPHRRDAAGAILCVECEAHRAETFCEQCHDYFCELCFGGQHRKGKRRLHTAQPVVAPAPASTTPVAVATGAGNPTPAASRRHAPLASDEDDDDSDDDDDDDDESSDDGGSADSDDDDDESELLVAGARRQTWCDLMGHLFAAGTWPRSRPAVEPAAGGSVAAAQASASSVLERAKFIPVRLTYEERKLLRTLEAALAVSHYTDKLDAPAHTAPAKRLRSQLQEICGFLSGLAVALDYKDGQAMLEHKRFAEHAAAFQELFELGRRYKIMNPEKLRGEYGKLMYLLQDASSPEIRELLGFSCVKKIRTVYDELAAAGALDVLRHPKIETATMVVAPEGKTRAQIQRLIAAKNAAIRELSGAAPDRRRRDVIEQCLYSIADNNYHLYFERDPIDRMIALLTTHFSPDDDASSLAIVSGHDGARLSHSHARQFHYVLQSLTLWREIAHDLFRLWCLTDDDLLDCDGARYELRDTGQGLHRVQPAPRVSRAMHVLLHATQRRLDAWVGSSVIHLGDKNVPNALMFIDKYTQVGHILRPIVKTVDALDALARDHPRVQRLLDGSFGGVAALRQAILADFFREAFDGSGADNFFEAGSCIDGRLTSAWNWCSRLHEKPFFPVFKLAGFVGFDGKFG
ncbi:hypothetical protein ATCC90586_002571 [Pythium insidiosum]|nr:hypothetical protein ATCC90586_002571 [Pythium insidiosum]